MSRVLRNAMFVGRFPEMSETFILRQTARPLESGDKAAISPIPGASSGKRPWSALLVLALRTAGCEVVFLRCTSALKELVQQQPPSLVT